MFYVNWLAVLVAGLVHFAIGAVWYSPLLFAGLWQKLSGIAEFKPTPKDMVLALLSSFVVAYALAIIINHAGARTIMSGIKMGILVEVGFIGTLLFGDMIFEKKPFQLFLLRNAYNLTALIVIGAILAVWR